MRILFLSQVLPYPLDAGPKVRSYHTLQYLAQTHDVTLVTFVRSTDSADAVAHLRRLCEAVYTVPMARSRLLDVWHLAKSLFRHEPFLITRDWVPAMATQILTLLQRASPFDAIHADQLWMAPYALEAQHADASRGHHPVLVLDQHNAVFQIPRRLAQHERNPIKRGLLQREARVLQQLEPQMCSQFDHVVWVTGEDRDAVHLRSHQQNAPTNGRYPQTTAAATHSSIIPICVDTREQKRIRRHPDARRVTFLGGLHWPPNAEGVIWFAREVWPHVHAAVPDAVLTIIGKNPPGSLVTAGYEDAGIDVTGYVADLTPYLVDTAVCIVPLHAGGGMRVKILDAWSWGLPVVSTSIGAEGIQAEHENDILLVDSAGEFAQAVIRVLADTVVADRLAAGGRHTVETQYDWRRVYRAWDEVYRAFDQPPLRPIRSNRA